MVLSDREIKEYVKSRRMIDPFVDKQISNGVISYGLSSYGYDFRVSEKFKIFTNFGEVIDPKRPNVFALRDHTGEHCDIPPNTYALAESVEYFRIPRDIIAICLGKSTYARCGFMINITPLEPEWEGRLTIEIANASSLPARIYANEGIGQLIFLRASQGCEVSYADKKGIYQGQAGLTLPIVRDT